MKYDLFVSYAHTDDAEGHVSSLIEHITDRLWHLIGDRPRLFFDQEDIAGMADWESRLAEGLRDSRLLLAVVSSAYFASSACRREWEEFTRYEAMRQCLGDGIAPIYFADVAIPEQALPAASVRSDEWLPHLRRRQWCDLRFWRNVPAGSSPEPLLAEQLDLLCNGILERLRRIQASERSPTNVYRHNPQFVGRVTELTQLRQTLVTQGATGIIHQRDVHVTHGLGGLGKTELALAYAHSFAWDYPGGRWLVRGEGIEDLDVALQQLAMPLALALTTEEQKDPAKAAERILFELRDRARTLLIFDNVTVPDLIHPDRIIRLPPHDRLHVIVTTRLGSAHFGGSLSHYTFVAVDELPPDDALALLQSHQVHGRFQTPEDRLAAGQLVALLDGFTLAIETAAVYLGRHRECGKIAAYVERLQRALLPESDAAASDPVVAVRHREKLLEHTLSLTLALLDDLQTHVIQLCAFLPADKIVLEWVRSASVETTPIFIPDHQPDAASFDDAVTTLLSLRLIQYTDDARVARMHRLIQELLRSRTTSGEDVESAFLLHVNSRLEIANEGWVPPEHRWELTALTAYAFQWLKHPGEHAPWLATHVSASLHILGNYLDAERLEREALRVIEQRFGPDHPETAISLHNLGLLLQDIGNLAEAEVLIRRALAVMERHFGSEDLRVASDLASLGGILSESGQFEEAETVLRRALSINDSKTADDSLVRRAVILNNLTSVLVLTRRFDEGIAAMTEAIAITEAALGPEHPHVATMMLTLSHCLRGAGRSRDAEAFARRSFEISSASLSPAHPILAGATGDLARILFESNRTEDAASLSRQALAIAEEALGPNHPRLVDTLNTMVGTALTDHRIDEAELLIRRALSIAEQHYRRGHPTLIHLRNNLAAVLRSQSRIEEAVAVLREAIAAAEETLGEGLPETTMMINNLSIMLQDMNQLEEAISLRLRVVHEMFRQSRESRRDHPKLDETLTGYAGLLERAGWQQENVRQHIDALARSHGFQITFTNRTTG